MTTSIPFIPTSRLSLILNKVSPVVQLNFRAFQNTLLSHRKVDYISYQKFDLQYLTNFDRICAYSKNQCTEKPELFNLQIIMVKDIAYFTKYLIICMFRPKQSLMTALQMDFFGFI